MTYKKCIPNKKPLSLSRKVSDLTRGERFICPFLKPAKKFKLFIWKTRFFLNSKLRGESEKGLSVYKKRSTSDLSISSCRNQWPYSLICSFLWEVRANQALVLFYIYTQTFFTNIFLILLFLLSQILWLLLASWYVICCLNWT